MNSGRPSTTIIGGMAGKLPYNHLVFKGEDSRSTLVGTCFQILCVLLDFQSGGARDVVAGSGESQTSAPTARTNAFRYFLMKLVGILPHASLLIQLMHCPQHRTQDFAFIIEGVVGILEQHTATVHNVLPGARKSVPYIPETGLPEFIILQASSA
jgi:hypothetical protein